MKVKIISENLFEDFNLLFNRKYKDSIKKARGEYKRGKVFTHEEVFVDLNDKTS